MCKLFFVMHGTGDNYDINLDWFVTAATPVEAFVMWRRHVIDNELMSEEKAARSDDQVSVYPVPVRAREPCVHDWKHEEFVRYECNMNTLATLAIEMSLRE